MNRRGFLKSILAVPAVWWLPLTAQAVTTPLSQVNLDEVNRITRETIMPRVVEDFFEDSPFFEVVARG